MLPHITLHNGTEYHVQKCVQHVGKTSCDGYWLAGSTPPSSVAEKVYKAQLTDESHTTARTPQAHQGHQRILAGWHIRSLRPKKLPWPAPLTHQYRDAKPLPPFNRHRLMHAVDLVRQSCTTMGCGDRGAGRVRGGREQRQAEILPLAPTNTTRTHRLAMLRPVRGTHPAGRIFRVCQHLMRVTSCFLPGFFCGVSGDRDASPARDDEWAASGTYTPLPDGRSMACHRVRVPGH